MTAPTLPGIWLCSIVKNEIMNPAGGIRDMVESTLPHLEGGVIVDTGSTDGTLEELRRLEKEYEHLFVYQHPFDGFGPSRNYSLARLREVRERFGRERVRYGLVLDADERLDVKSAWVQRLQLIQEQNCHGRVKIIEIGFSSKDEIDVTPRSLNPRLVNLDDEGFYFYGRVWENICRGFEFYCIDRDGLIRINHFVPDEKHRDAKEYWYSCIKDFRLNDDFDESLLLRAPINSGKRYNPRREQFR